MFHEADGMGWWMLWGGIMMILFWGGIIALAVWAAQSLGRPRADGGQIAPAGHPGARPLDVAKERYARGEITREEFEQLKKDLE